MNNAIAGFNWVMSHIIADLTHVINPGTCLWEPFHKAQDGYSSVFRDEKIRRHFLNTTG
jgi:hypothetical protein